MKSDRELLARALECIPDGMKLYEDLRADIRARLAEDDEEPVGYMWEPIKLWLDSPDFPPGVVSDIPIIPVYRRPQPKARLSDEEIDDVIKRHRFAYGMDANAYSFARAIERRINGEEE